MAEQELKIIYRDYGIADAFPDGTIELNKHLKKYPNLEKSLIQHELKHSRIQKFTKRDFVHDLTTMNQISQWQMVKFMVRHPFSMVQILPVYYSKKRGLIYDINSMIIWGIFLTIVGVAMLASL